MPITEDGAFSGQSPPALLQYASDPDALPGDPALTAVAGTVTSSDGATVTIAANGTFTYNAAAAKAVRALDPGQTTQDTFTYQVADFQGARAQARSR